MPEWIIKEGCDPNSRHALQGQPYWYDIDSEAKCESKFQKNIQYILFLSCSRPHSLSNTSSPAVCELVCSYVRRQSCGMPGWL